MRKLLSNGLVVFAGIMVFPSPINKHLPVKSIASEYRLDPRTWSLTRFFEDAGCPAARVSLAFVQAADRYDLDWRLLPSISFIESTGGKAARNNNLFGWDSGRAAFPSMTAAIYQVAYSLANSRLYRDKSLDEILATYNPDADYAQRVKSVMRQISQN